MTIHEALAALHTLTDLPEARRRYLAVLAADAPTDADRKLIVVKARHECRTVRENLSADLRAEFDARRVAVAERAQRPAEVPQKPSQRRFPTPDGIRYPASRPVVITWTSPTKISEPVKVDRRPLVGKAPEKKNTLEKKPKAVPVIAHGTLSGYTNGKCRCPACAEVWRDYSREYARGRSKRKQK
ncbi:hypothetical protein [Microbacterium sp. CR_7]|uniref:hypothetical protein n=1 Tax=Microbacterium sp. CR_7 TaxID=3055792 RepID=UPI0035BEE067